MLLTVDIGNYRIKVGGFVESQLVFADSLLTEQEGKYEDYERQLCKILDRHKVETDKIDGIAISSVVSPASVIFNTWSERSLNKKPLVLGAGTDTGLKIKYEHPEQLGSDRIAAAVGACRLCPGAILVVDLGTATTFTLISAVREILGGSIAPGIGTAARLLSECAYQLPSVELKKSVHLIATNTEEAMQSGVIYGFASLVEGMIYRVKEKYSTDCSVVITGGNAEVVLPFVKGIDHYEQWLILKGLQIVWERYVKSGIK